MGVEPTYAAWEAAVLPMNYTRDLLSYCTVFLAVCQAGESGIRRLSFGFVPAKKQPQETNIAQRKNNQFIIDICS